MMITTMTIRRSIRHVTAALAAMLFLLATPTAGAQAPPLQTALAAPRFADQIAKLVDEDRRNPPAEGSILFIGSSIFRLWTTLAEQMAPLPVYNRAFGGSRTHEMLEQFDTLVLPHKPRIIVYYCGSNDVSGGEPADAIIGRVTQFVERVERALPGTQVFFVSINKAPEKRDRWDVVDKVNAEIFRYGQKGHRLHYIDVNPALFDAQGNARTELYVADMLHFKPPAYEAFTTIIEPVLARAWAAR
jgi:lysophospholipase L1-like esterase